MARTFDFTTTVRNDAYFRQNGHCAVCERNLQGQEEFGHHVIPNQSGDPSNLRDHFLRTAANCVMLCHACHWVVHEGGLYAVGAMPPPDYYQYANPRTSDQTAWEALVRREYLRIYNKRFKAFQAEQT